MGSRTGRAAGLCAGYEMPGYANPAIGGGFGRGFGRGRGFGGGRGRGGGFGGGGRGWQNRHYATGQLGWMRFGGYPPPYQQPNPDPELEMRALQNQAGSLQVELDAINKRLGELESESTTD